MKAVAKLLNHGRFLLRKKIQFVFGCFIFLFLQAGSAVAQMTVSYPIDKKDLIKNHRGLLSNQPSFSSSLSLSGINPRYLNTHWGVFCEMEYRLQQRTGIPLRFRLGSLAYVNYLEGKKSGY
jgi:hypothetical protein